MYKLPIKCPNKPVITQLYGNKTYVQWYKDHGINIPFHNGVDFVTGDNVKTYGTPLVCPFPTGKVVKIQYDSPLSTSGNGVYLESMPNETGIYYRIILWHTGEIVVKYNQQVKEGDVVCYIGNSGLCNPAPTTESPYSGSHLHFGCYKMKKGEYLAGDNSIMGESDPLLYFDKDQWYLGEDSGMGHDIEPLKWRWSKLGTSEWWIKLLEAYKFWK